MSSFKRYTDPIEFRKDVYPILLRNEAENCLGIGVIDTLINVPERYSKFHLAAIKSSDPNTIVGAAWITPPHPLGITRISATNIKSVVDFALDLPEKPSGVIGPSEIADKFMELWVSSSRANVKTCMRLFIYELRKVDHEFTTAGSMRLATSNDRDLLEDWNLRFSIECGLGKNLANARESAVNAIQYKTRFFWQIDNIIVSMAGLAGSTPNGIRIGWVYTPPDFRGKGYASALVTSISQEQLDKGKKFCFLHTDQDNVTSNAIYQRIGYKKVSESTHYIFEY